jgi:hypothetical protein
MLDGAGLIGKCDHQTEIKYDERHITAQSSWSDNQDSDWLKMRKHRPKLCDIAWRFIRTNCFKALPQLQDDRIAMGGSNHLLGFPFKDFNDSSVTRSHHD